MAMKRVSYDESFNDDMATFLELIKRNAVIRAEAMSHKNPDQLFSIAIRRMIMSYNKQHANDKPLTQTQIDAMILEYRSKKDDN